MSQQDAADSIIGQFGIGFYSTFIVSDYVEVFSKTGSDAPGVKWSSEGGGEYDIAQVGNLPFTRGTKIVLHLKPSCLDFAKESAVEKIIKKHS